MAQENQDQVVQVAAAETQEVQQEIHLVDAVTRYLKQVAV